MLLIPLLMYLKRECHFVNSDNKMIVYNGKLTKVIHKKNTCILFAQYSMVVHFFNSSSLRQYLQSPIE